MRKVCITYSGRADYHTLKYLADKMKRHFDVRIEPILRVGEWVPDFAIVLGDRYEAILHAVQAVRKKICLVHLHGGEVTTGSMDEHFRHAITKLAHYHFASTNKYMHNVIRLGENKENVFDVGALGVERVKSLRRHLPKKKQILITWHPNTVHKEDRQNEFDEILLALDKTEGYRKVFFHPNTDPGYEPIIEKVKKFENSKPVGEVFVEHDAGDEYINLMDESMLMIGNSSAGIIEAPCCETPTLNVGDRQLGRLQGPSVWNCSIDRETIFYHITKILARDPKDFSYQNPYEKQGTSDAIINVLKTCEIIHYKEWIC